MLLPVLSVLPRAAAYSQWHLLLNDLLWVNFYWGLMNLLPVYPLDGGHAAMAIFEQAVVPESCVEESSGVPVVR